MKLTRYKGKAMDQGVRKAVITISTKNMVPKIFSHKQAGSFDFSSKTKRESIFFLICKRSGYIFICKYFMTFIGTY